MEKQKPYSLRLPPSLKEKLQQQANEEGRKLGNLIIHILTQYLKNANR